MQELRRAWRHQRFFDRIACCWGQGDLVPTGRTNRTRPDRDHSGGGRFK